MSEGSTAALGPVSVRYAAQIRELLHVQAVQRMAADHEAARAAAEAERAARIEAAARPKTSAPADVKVEAPEPKPLPAPVQQAEAPAEKPAAPGKLVDIQA